MKRSSTLVSRLFLSGLAISAALCGCAHNGGGETPSSTGPLPEVTVMSVTRGTVTQSLPVTGVLGPMPSSEVTITPLITGTLQTLAVQLGQSVVRGQLIAQISTQSAMQQVLQAQATAAQAQLQVQQAQAASLNQVAQTSSSILQAEANVRSAQATLAADDATLTGDQAASDNAEQNLLRDHSLYGEGLLAQKDEESAELDLTTAKSAVDVEKKQIESQEQTISALQQMVAAAKTGRLEDLVKQKDISVAQQQVINANAALTAARSQLALYTLTSPISGTVTEVGAAAGESVDPTTKIVSVADLTKLQLVLSVPSGSVQSISPGELVTFFSDVDPGQKFTAAVTNVSNQIDPTGGTVSVYAQIPNASGVLKDNTAVLATVIESQQANVLCVPQNAVLNDPATNAKSVATIDATNTLHIVPVTTGQVVNNRIEIISGISAGDRIAVTGQYGLTDGTKVDVAPYSNDQNGGDGS